MEYLVLEEVFSCAKPSVSPAAIFFLDGDSASWSYGCLRCFRDPSHHHPPPVHPFSCSLITHGFSSQIFLTLVPLSLTGAGYTSKPSSFRISKKGNRHFLSCLKHALLNSLSRFPKNSLLPHCVPKGTLKQSCRFYRWARNKHTSSPCCSHLYFWFTCTVLPFILSARL